MTTGRKLLATIVLLAGSQAGIRAQEVAGDKPLPDIAPADSITVGIAPADSITVGGTPAMSIAADSTATDSLSQGISAALEQQPKKIKTPRDWTQWKPNPQRALWLALVIPGGGQIYNRKYWKLPIVYGGFIGCLYAMNWNNNMYKDYSQAYLDLCDSDPGTASYNKFMHLGQQIRTQADEARYKEIFRKRKDKYRRWRDLSFFVMVGVYALSVIDAYVDAELSVFDISKDLSLSVEPAIMNDANSRNPLDSSVGVHCSLNF